MRILHLTETDYKVGLWSGGSTTELFIWPEGADYGKREFTLRVSSARVDLEESDFTPLQGAWRENVKRTFAYLSARAQRRRELKDRK